MEKVRLAKKGKISEKREKVEKLIEDETKVRENGVFSRVLRGFSEVLRIKP